MDKLNQKYTQFLQALKTLEKAVNAFKQLEENKKSFNPNLDYEEEYRTYRDSVIQRFEYTIDLFWKYLKKYLESKHILTGIKVPSEVIRQAYSLNIVSEEEAEKILEMIKSRNRTSHIYIEEIAEQLSVQIPKYFDVLHKIILRFSS